jgi:hypothetical protein
MPEVAKSRSGIKDARHRGRRFLASRRVTLRGNDLLHWQKYACFGIVAVTVDI